MKSIFQFENPAFTTLLFATVFVCCWWAGNRVLVAEGEGVALPRAEGGTTLNEMGKVVQEKTGEAIQKAINEVARKGGGVVFLPSGTYHLESPVTLRDNIALRGEGRATVLKRVKSKAFTVIQGFGLEGVIIENLAVDGNRFPEGELETSKRRSLYGITLSGCDNCKVINCAAYACAAMGISDSGGLNVQFIGCDSYNNGWHGYHLGQGTAGRKGSIPRSGSKHCTIKECTAHHNGDEKMEVSGVGIYICWHVTDSIIEGNHLYRNEQEGLLIGPFDNRNLIANNVISNNGRSGIIVCRRAHPCESNLFVNNILTDNGKPGETPAILIESPQEGRHQHQFFARNMIVETRDVKTSNASAIFIDEETDYITVSDNHIQGPWKSDCESRSKGEHNRLDCED